MSIMCLGFSHFSGFLCHFVMAKLAIHSMRVKTIVLVLFIMNCCGVLFQAQKQSERDSDESEQEEEEDEPEEEEEDLEAILAEEFEVH